MINLSEYLNESLLLEFAKDMAPQVLIIMGGPGAGKTTWMNKSASKFFKRDFQAKRLDSDNNLKVEQRKNMFGLAEEIMLTLSADSSSAFDTRKESFAKLIADTQKKYDEQSKKNGSPLTDLSPIDYKFCKAWADRYDRAAENQKEKVMREFQSAFEKEYFEDVFASDFSRRNISKAQYKKDMVDKLTGIVDTDVELYGAQDVMVAITGDEIEKIDQIKEMADQMGATTSILYLDIPADRAVAQDARRARSLGEKFVRAKLEEVHKTWDLLTKVYKEHGIFRMWWMVPGPKTTERTLVWEPKQQFLNTNMIGK